ncbi:amidohydrolase [Candidatus Soleaferrea massiliensis]|uniref:amidohydrolase n=1 Tax=Candidatus Soleaferrea massiliensis TaxID=1470354 RepID=UPI00058DE1AA|nr:amidohydrolase [Candidatus Soleaferrea massiliensis]
MSSTIYYGGDIITMEEPLYAEAMLVEGSVIKRTGTLEEVQRAAGPYAKTVDLKGKTLLPAFIDAHSHLTGMASTLGSVNLNGAGSFDEIKERVQQFKEEHKIPEGQWITAFGYDPEFLEEREHPTKALLDEACPDHPLVVTHASGHMGVANSKALEKLDVTAETEDPQGGVIGRCEGSDEPNGYLEENAFTSCVAKIPPCPDEQAVKQLKEAQEIYLSYGIATVQDGLTKTHNWEMLKRMSDEGDLVLDTVCYADLVDSRQVVEDHPDYRNYRNHLRIGGYKIFLDGSPQGCTAWMQTPYLGEGDYKGYPVHQDAQVRDFMKTALSEGKQILVHCNGDAAAAQMIDSYRAAMEESGEQKDIRPVMIHAQLAQPDQLPEMRRLKIIASFFVAHVYYWGDVHIKNFGLKRASKISPAASAVRDGELFTFHQDSPVLPPDMLMTIWCAVNRVTRGGVILGEQEKISPLEALKAVTINAAYQYFEEGRKGSLKAGKLADLVFLDRNPLKVHPDEIRQIKILRTDKEGRTLYER